MNIDPSKVTNVYGLLAVIGAGILGMIGRPQRAWLRGVLLLVVLSISAAGIYVMVEGPWPGEFRGTARNDLDPVGATCLDSRDDVIPASTRVCVGMSGAWGGPWAGGMAPFGTSAAPHQFGTMVWTESAARTRRVITVQSRYTHPNEFVASEDYVVCVEPPVGARRFPGQPMTISITPTKSSCGTPTMP
jgi:hypothetical protein